MKIISLNIDGYKMFNPSPKLRFGKEHHLLIGVNGSGKSTVLEAIALIFSSVKDYCLDGVSREQKFRFSIEYSYTKSSVIDQTSTTLSHTADILHIKLSNSKEGGHDFTLAVNNDIVKDLDNMLEFLPDNLIFYYAGFSETLEKIVFKSESEQALKLFRVKVGKGLQNIDGYLSKNILYIRKEHYPVLFLLNYLENETKLPFSLKIFDINSISLILQKPTIKGFDGKDFSNLYNLQGFLRIYLDNLLKYSQPISIIPDFQDPYFVVEYHRGIIEAVEDMEGLSEDMKYVHQRYLLFHIYNILFHIGILKKIEVTIRDDKKNVFKIDDLSEGEQQLITIEAIKRVLCKDNTVLFLDEPDSFLHPQRQRLLMPHIKEIFTEQSTQIITTTHSPFVAQSMPIESVMIFDDTLKKVIYPERPISSYPSVTTELFYVPSQFNNDKENKLSEFRRYRDKILNDEPVIKSEMAALVKDLSKSGAEIEAIIARELNQLSRLKNWKLNNGENN